MTASIGWWRGDPAAVATAPASLLAAVRAEGRLFVVRRAGEPPALATQGELTDEGAEGLPECLAVLPPLEAPDLGCPTFRKAHGLRYAYLGGGMARGIGSTALVAELARGGMLGFFGAAGLGLAEVEAAVEEIAGSLGEDGGAWGVNLIHTPEDPAREAALVDAFLERGVRRVEAAAFVGLTPAVARYACRGLEPDGAGGVRRKHHLFAKVSRVEVARHFLAPVPEAMLLELLETGAIDPAEAELARRISVASALTVEADSAGHTDNRPLGPAYATIAAEARRLAAAHDLAQGASIGVAGGLGTPACLASAFALGAAYVLVGSVHQACVEAGTSDLAREMLAAAGVADVAMTASADMFERGARVQVLRRGTMMPQRGNFLVGLYQRRASLDELEPGERSNLERNIFRATLEEVWEETQAYLEAADPGLLALARRDPRTRMAMVFRWYLGKSSRWAQVGDESRRTDLQIWCGPAMGAFNAWVQGSFLEDPSARRVGAVAMSLLEGAAQLTRSHLARSCGVPLPAEAFHAEPSRASAVAA